MARFFVVAIVLALCVGHTSAQNFPVQVRWLDYGEEDLQQSLNTEIGEALRGELEWRDIPSEGQGMHLYFRAEELQLSEGNLIVLSLVEAHPLSERVVQAGAKNQIWYAERPQPENAEDARFVREYMTREFLANQAQITNIVQLAFPRTELSIAVSNYFDSLFERTRCMRPDEECI